MKIKSFESPETIHYLYISDIVKGVFITQKKEYL